MFKTKRIEENVRMNRRAFLRDIMVFLGFSGLTALMTWPWILHLRDAVSDTGDPYPHAYWLWWDYYQTFHDPSNLFGATIFYPYKYTLAFSENDYGVALLFFPLHALGFRPLTVLSVATLVAFAFSGYGMFRLTRTLTDSKSAAWVSGIIFAFLPYHFQRLPHLPLIFAGWIPLTLEALVLFSRQRSWRRAAWLSVAFVMNALTCIAWFILILVPFGLSAVFLLAWLRLGKDRAFWMRGGVALGVAALALLWFMFPYYRVHEMYGFARSAADATGLSAYPIHWLAVSERNKLWHGLGGSAAIDELTLFPGFLPPLLALAAFFLIKPALPRDRALRLKHIGLHIPLRTLLVLLDVLALTLLVTALLAIGYGSIHFRLFGFELFRCSSPTRPLIFFLATLCLRWSLARPEIIHRVLTEKNLVRNLRANPRSVAFGLGAIWALTGFFGSFGMHFFFHRILFELVPFFKSMRAPVRWAMMCYVGLSILAGLGATQFVESLARGRPRVPRTAIYVVLAVFILFEQRVAPIQFVRGEADPDAITLRLKETPMAGGIVELPAEKDSYAYYRYMLRAADHGRPIVTASSSFAPPIVLELESLTRTRPIPDRFIDLLETIPTSYLVVHNSLLPLESRYAIESVLARGLAAGRIKFINSYGEPIKRDDLYAITKTEPKAQSEAPLPPTVSLAQRTVPTPSSSSPDGESSSASNPIDETNFFVRQQYLDVLGREPDQAGQDSLSAFIKGCRGEPNCVQERRILGALGFFRSRELNETSYFVYRLYETALGRTPSSTEWANDIDRLRAKVAESRLSFAEEWISRTEFTDRYPAGLTDSEYVNKLLQTSVRSLGQSEREELINRLSGDRMSRAAVLVYVMDHASTTKRDHDKAFVTLCYFSYLKREPGPEGSDYWLQTLTNNSNDEAGVIRGFIYSREYRARFGPP